MHKYANTIRNIIKQARSLYYQQTVLIKISFANSVAFLADEPAAIHFLNEAFSHCKAIAADTAALRLLKETHFYRKLPKHFTEENEVTKGIIIGDYSKVLSKHFIKAIAQNRFWEGKKKVKVSAINL